MIRVVAVDPGPTPGVVMITDETATVRWSVFQCDADSLAWLVRRLLRLPAPPPRIVLAVERFVIGMRSARLSNPGAAAVTRDQIGALTDLGRDLPGVELVRRSASEVMPWASDKRLTAAGLLAPTKGMPHARAAARHALFASVRDGNLPDPLSTKVRAR